MRLVEQPDLGPSGHQDRERGAPALAGRELRRRDVGQATVEPEARQRGVDVGGRGASGPAPETDVVGHREVVVETGLVGEHPHVGADGTRIADEVDPGDRRLALDHRHEAGARAEERGLAGSVRALEEHDLALGDLQIDAGERRESTEHRHRVAEVDDRLHQDHRIYGVFDARDRSGRPGSARTGGRA